MKNHIIPSIVASLVASGIAVGFVHVYHAPRVDVVTAPAGAVSPNKAAHLAKTVWPEISQKAVDSITAAIKGTTGEVTIFCVSDQKCGDLALNLDNAFESARWKSTVLEYPMVQPGIWTSSADLLAVLRAAGLEAKLDKDMHVISGDAIAIGHRPQG